MTTIYLSGPMSGIPHFNIPAFEAATAHLRSLGLTVVSPVELDGTETRDRLLLSESGELGEGDSWAHYLLRDVGVILVGGIDEVQVLKGWEESRGSRVEAAVARALGIPVREYDGDGVAFTPDRAQLGDPRFHALLKEIGDLHDRKQRDYGVQTDPFANVRGSSDWGVEPWVGAMIRANDKVKRLQKYARVGNLSNESAHDSFLDLAVYALIGDILHSETQE